MPLLKSMPPDTISVAGHDVKFTGRVLLVEDNETNLVVAQVWLEKAGLTVRTAEHGEAALKLLEQEAFDIVLMDCQMPVLDGFAATQLLRQNEAEQGGHLTVIAITANAMDGDRERCLQAGMDDYLAKPYTGPELRNMLMRWLPLATASSASKPAVVPPHSDKEAIAASGIARPPIDDSVLATICAIDPENAKTLQDNLISTYLRTAPLDLAAVRDGLAGGDAQKIIQSAHKLKASNHNVGATTLAQTFLDIETLARQNDFTAIELRISPTLKEWQRVESALKTRLGEQSQ